jgi:hypothetical protein
MSFHEVLPLRPGYAQKSLESGNNMSNKIDRWMEDWVPILIFFFFVALCTGFVLFIAQYVFAPFLTQLNIYFSNYGRMTAEVFALFTTALLGWRYHEKILNGLVEKFANLSVFAIKLSEVFGVWGFDGWQNCEWQWRQNRLLRPRQCS